MLEGDARQGRSVLVGECAQGRSCRGWEAVNVRPVRRPSYVAVKALLARLGSSGCLASELAPPPCFSVTRPCTTLLFFAAHFRSDRNSGQCGLPFRDCARSFEVPPSAMYQLFASTRFGCAHWDHLLPSPLHGLRAACYTPSFEKLLTRPG